MYMIWATIAYFLMVTGVVLRKRRPIHVRLMLTAIAMDLCLVGLLEVKRDAVAKALEFSMGPLQQMHIGFSTVAVALYLPVLSLGIMRLRGVGPLDWHIRLGLAAFIFRTLGFLFMFSLLMKPNSAVQ